tara:strand:- start:6123 stop:6797 length:675 start_codon:yes stop_codon:yes gene_type:complete
MKKKNLYSVLGITRNAKKSEIKSAYRNLAKKFHPDTGGNKDQFLAIQSAWEILNDPLKKREYDQKEFLEKSSIDYDPLNWSAEIRSNKVGSSTKDSDIKEWIRYIYNPINSSVNQIIKNLNLEVKKLSGDPYDDELMEAFCIYIEKSKKKIDKAGQIYKSLAVPSSISSIGLDLYHCFSQVQDALDEFERYTASYIDSYLFDGKEMMKEAKRIQTKMSNNKKGL